MAMDEHLAQRLRSYLEGREGIVEKRMFGGSAFLLRGNMSVGVHKQDLMVRVGEAAFAALCGLPGARPMDFTGRPMKGWLTIAGDTLGDDATLRAWAERGLAFAATLPPK